MPRNYKPNGRPNGGRREGSGRPAGSKNTLGLGEVRALKALGLRVPEGASEEQRTYALHTESRIIDVMSGDVSPALAMAVLKAATALREEQLGPVKQRVEHSFDGLTDEQLEAKYRAVLARAAAEQISDGAGTTAKAAEPKGDDASLGPNGETREGES